MPFKQGDVVRIHRTTLTARYYIIRRPKRFYGWEPDEGQVGFVAVGGIDPQGYVQVTFPMIDTVWVHKNALEVVHASA